MITAIVMASASESPAVAASSVMAGSAVAVPAAVTQAIAAAGSQSIRSGIAVLDTTTGQYWEAGDAEGQFPSESVVKVLIAARLLADGQMTGQTEQLAFEMITQSDDDAADTLWGLVGGPDVVSWAAQRYGISDLGAAPIDASRWGNTKLTPRGLTEFYADVKADPAVGPWLMSAMSQMTPDGSDGTDQTFGLPSASAGGAYKQGWGGDDDNFNSEGLNSTGYLDNGRYAVAIFTQHIPWISMSTLVPVINSLAVAVAPNGVVAALPTSGPVASAVPTASSVLTASAVPAAAAAVQTSPASAVGAVATSGSASPAASAPVSSVAASSTPTTEQARGEKGNTAGAARHTRTIDGVEASSLGAVAVLALLALVATGRLRRRHAGSRDAG